jgi:hypothetical protein
MVVKTDRLAHGKSLKNMSYSQGFNEFCNQLASVSTRAYKTVHKHFGGRGIRSMRYIRILYGLTSYSFIPYRELRAKLPRFDPGVSIKNVQNAVSVLEKLNYNGPLALGWDDTDLEPALSTWQAVSDKGSDTWVVLGSSQGPIRVTSAAEVDAVFDNIKIRKADKV